MGKKYVIEVADNYFCDDLGTKYWRIKGVDGFILDGDDLSNLEEYKEPVGHKFEVGDVCRWKEIIFKTNDKIFITKITDLYVEYLTKTGDRKSMLRGVFETSADFVNHSTIFKVLSEE